jgi:hypothetical protein
MAVSWQARQVPAIQENEEIVVFWTGADGQLMRIWETDWMWRSLGGEVVGSPAACSNEDGVLVVFGAFDDEELRFRAQVAPNDDNWSEWAPVTDPVTAAPAAILNLDLRMQVIIPGFHGTLDSMEQPTAGDLHWKPNPPLSLNGIAVGAPVISRNGHVLPDPDGRLEAFHIGLTGSLSRVAVGTGRRMVGVGLVRRPPNLTARVMRRPQQRLAP